MNPYYMETVRLLIDVIPYVFKNNEFALKGGTAINLFYRNMPRLSVDLDLVYTKFSNDRSADLAKISNDLLAMQALLRKHGFTVDEKESNEKNVSKLIIKRGIYQVKVEVNYVIRGTLLPIGNRTICDAAIELFKMECAAPILAEDEIYAGKLVAALDRQHPRDLYDVFNLYKVGGISAGLVENFVCYLCSHDRPFREVIKGNDKDISREFEAQFVGMTRDLVSLDTLLAIRSKLRSDILRLLTEKQKEFLLSFARAEPNWNLMKCGFLGDLPAIRWKLKNLEKLKKTNKEKFRHQCEDLQGIF